MFASNSILDLLCRHRSVRVYTKEAISEEQINELVKAGQAVSSSHFLQTATIIRITDKKIRKKMEKLAGNQPQIVNAPEFWIFCADFNRNKQINKNLTLNKVDHFLVSTIDTAIMAQNVVIAAESMALGCVYIGGIRNQIEEVTTLLNIPKYVVPLFGLCIGYPDQNPDIKPRMPKELMFFENRYKSVERELVKAYDETMCAYYQSRGDNQKFTSWSYSLGGAVNNDRDDAMMNYLQRQGWIGK